MNPYLEARWYDFHTRFVAYASDQLNETLPQDLMANTEERVAVEHDGIAVEHTYRPDVRIEETERRNGDHLIEPAEPGGVLTEKAVKLIIAEPATERFIEIMEPQTKRVVTVIELISPSNKRGPGLRAYRKKRRQLLGSDVNVVEIDLVRKGNWKALLLPHTSPREKHTPYRATLRFAAEPDAVYLIPMKLQETLPEVPVPLRKGDQPLFLKLQPLVNAVYERGRCEQAINYSATPPEPQMSEEETAWCADIAKKAGLR